MPKVSICVPCYQNKKEVERLLDSVKIQTFQEYEVILTDDSKDEQIQNYIEALRNSKADIAKKIRYYHNEKPLGHIFNWNKALSYAKGEYIKIMFSDDWFTYPDSLEKLVWLLENNSNADLAFSASMQVSATESYARKIEEGYIEKLKNDYRYLFISNQIGAPSDTLYRSKIKVSFDEKSNWASDVFLYMEILKRNPYFAYVEEPLISIGIHDNQYTESFTENDIRIFKDYEYMFQKYALKESNQCRIYFLKQYLVKQKNGLEKALRNGYEKREYRLAKWEWYRNEVIPGYWNGLKRKIRGKK